MTKTFKNSVRIDDNIVTKKLNKEVLELYDYLNIRNFNNFPEIVEVTDTEMKSQYIEKIKYHEITEGIELIKVMAELHKKTLFLKTIDYNKYKEIYDKLLGNIEYLNDYYDKLIEEIELEEYMSPSHYLFARNYSVILGSLKYSKEKLNKWYSLVKDKSEERVCIVHNNISSDHFIKGDKNYLISFEKHLVDTPILDLFKYYKKEGYKKNFKYLLTEYNKTLELLPEEDLLLKVLISLPPKMVLLKDEISNISYVYDSLKYIYNGYNVIKE